MNDRIKSITDAAACYNKDIPKRRLAILQKRSVFLLVQFILILPGKRKLCTLF